MRVKILVLLLLSFVFFQSPSLAELTEADKAAIRQGIHLIEQALEKGDPEAIAGLISPHAAPGLLNEIKDVLGEQKIHFEVSIGQWVDVPPASVKVKGSFSASGKDWKANGIGNYFVFENIGGRWVLLETDFHKKLDPEFWLNWVRTILLVLVPVFIITLAFWIWMLVDCLQKSGPNMLVWVLVIIFLNVLGALLYFFIERKKPLPEKSS